MKLAGNHTFRKCFTYAWLLKICVVCFYFGYRNAANESKYNSAIITDTATNCATPIEISDTLRQQIDARVKKELSRSRTESYTGKLFPDTTKEYAVGALRVPRDEMLSSYDFGVPIKKTQGKETESIILYNTRSALPSSNKLKNSAVSGENGEMAKSSVSDAMQNCDALNVIFTSMNNKPECQLIIGNFESYHINRWLRMPDFEKTHKKKRMEDHTLPLRHMGRITLPAKGVDEFDLPEFWNNMKKGDKGFLLEHFDRLSIFLENVDSVMKDLKELLEKRNVVRDNTVVVLTVNAGQSELLSNQICAARSRGIDTGNVLVFPTDEESYKLATGLGVATYFDEKNLGVLPSGEAKAYGDKIFANMMYAKVLCVLYVSLLGHDVLFQDVDIGKF